MMKKILAVIVLSALIPATALANGGTKASSRIEVQNTSDTQLAVIVDPPAGTNQSNFVQNGGKILNPGEVATFKVKQGSHTIYGVYVDDVGNLGGETTTSVNVNRNATVKIHSNGSYSAGPAFTIK
jgi:hypothetical protein